MDCFLVCILNMAFSNTSSHEGKNDLEKSIPHKLASLERVLACTLCRILRDNDGGDCLLLKQRLMQSCRAAGRPDTTVRIVCQELEAWYLGEPDALADAFGKESLRRIGGRARFRDPDAVQQPSEALRRLVPGFRKVSGAKTMAGFTYARKKLFEEFSGPAVRA